MIREKLGKNTAKITICWIPSHVNTYGNEKADALAGRGARSKLCPSHRIVKAKILNMKWNLSHPRAIKTFNDMRKPKEVEKT